MFGKTKDFSGEQLDDHNLEEIFGDEEAAERQAAITDVRTRIEQVESQIASQFTSMAAYAQIAQEQVELARAESRADTERTERRVVELIERERADRIEAITGQSGEGAWGAPDVNARLDALERSVAEIKVGLADCLSRQKALADAITALFEPKLATLPPPTTSGPIGDLSLA